MGVLYILDEPSIGLHQRDNSKLIATLKRLRDGGNSLIVVEHDEETMEESDYIVDIGPGAGIHGGEIIAVGTPDEIKQNPKSITGAYLSGREKIEIPALRRSGNGKFLTVHGAAQNNLKHIDVTFPLGLFCCVTGVSELGQVVARQLDIVPRASPDLNRAYTNPGKYDSIEGEVNLDKIIAIDQSPIGRTPRSNPATYTGLSPISASCSPRLPTRSSAATHRAASRSTSKADAAKPARATESSASRCTFCPTCM